MKHRTEKDFPRSELRPTVSPRLLQQGQYCIGHGVGLRQHGRARLLQNLGTGQSRRHCGKVRTLNLALGRRQILRTGGQIAHHRSQPILYGPQQPLGLQHRIDRPIDGGDGLLRVGLSTDIHGGDTVDP